MILVLYTNKGCHNIWKVHNFLVENWYQAHPFYLSFILAGIVMYFLAFERKTKSYKVLPFSQLDMLHYHSHQLRRTATRVSIKKFPSTGVICCHVISLLSPCSSPNLPVFQNDCLSAHTFVWLQNKAMDLQTDTMSRDHSRGWLVFTLQLSRPPGCHKQLTAQQDLSILPQAWPGSISCLWLLPVFWMLCNVPAASWFP